MTTGHTSKGRTNTPKQDKLIALNKTTMSNPVFLAAFAMAQASGLIKTTSMPRTRTASKFRRGLGIVYTFKQKAIASLKTSS